MYFERENFHVMFKFTIWNTKFVCWVKSSVKPCM